jgi:hypothetical protein
MNEVTARRLAFIRYLYEEAVRQSGQPEPMCVASVLTFHDAAELFLVLACEHLDVGKTSMSFLGYWEELNRKLPDDGVTQKKAMSRLNEARVGLKHHGNMPAKAAIQDYRYIATLFFEENTPTMFGVEFGDLSMVYLVRHLAIRADLEEAEELREQGDLEGAVGKVAIAFHRLLKSQKERNALLSGLKWPGRSPTPTGYKYAGGPINFRPRRGEADKDGYARKKIGQILEQTDALKRAVEPMQDAMVALALGVDYERYRRFLKLTPEVGMRSPNDDIRYAPVPIPMWHNKPRYATPDMYRFCFDFVIEVAIRAQAT